MYKIKNYQNKYYFKVTFYSRFVQQENAVFTLDEMSTLLKYSPILLSIYQAIYELHSTKTEAISTLKSLFSTILAIWEATFNNFDDTFYTPIEKDTYEKEINSLPGSECANTFNMKELMTTGYHFPGYPVCRKIPEVRISSTTPVVQCNKTYKQKGTMTPGLVMFHCLDHNKCLGFIVQDKAESPKMISEVLLTRFETMPEVIVYDTACHLAEYMLNRFPTPCKKTIFMVDAFHYDNHVECAESFDSALYKELLQDVNSSLAEQKNSRITAMKKTAPWMKARNFMSKLVYVHAYLNKK